MSSQISKKSLPLADAIKTYLQNRSDFYAILLPRIPHLRIRNAISDAVRLRNAEHSEAMDLFNNLDQFAESDFLDALLLNDLLKKPSAGKTSGRLVISVEDCLAKVAELERTGLILFQTLSEQSKIAIPYLHAEIAYCRQILSVILTLEDDLRYHRSDLLDQG